MPFRCVTDICYEVFGLEISLVHPSCHSTTGQCTLLNPPPPITVKLTNEGTYDISSSSEGLASVLQGLSGSSDFKWYGWSGLKIPESEQGMLKAELAKMDATPVNIYQDAC
jgi:trehalose-6-phosphate synthase